MSSPAQSSPIADQILVGGGEMGDLMRAFDWSKTPLGPVEQWPQSLRSAVSILLPSKAQIILFWGPELTVLYNDAYRVVLGAKHPSVLGMPGWVCWSEVWEDTLGPLLKGVIETGEAFWGRDYQFILQRSGFTEETYFDISYDPVRDESGEVGGIFCIVSETTQRVLSERGLTTLRNLGTQTSGAQTVQEACDLALSVIGENPADIPFSLLYLIDSNQTTATFKGSTGFAGAHAAAPATLHLGDSSEGIWPLEEVLNTGKPQLIKQFPQHLEAFPGGVWEEPAHWALVLPLLRHGQDGVYGFLILGLSPRRRFDEAFEGFLRLVAGQVATSIANVQALEEERRRAEALAELNQAKTDFFSNVSHEFRTPLTLLLNPLEDSLRTQQGAPINMEWETAQSMHRNTLRLLKLVNTLLDFSRIESGRTQAVFEPTNLALLTAELASSFRSAIENAGLQFVVDCPPLPEAVYVDREMWEKIILNMLSNAFKFTHSGGITLSLRCVNDQVIIKISDTGIGIPEAELPHIFERFHRVRNAKARTYEGTGIGLSLVQELVRIHGGSIEVASDEGVGTTFTILIPNGTAHLPADQIQGEHALNSTAIAPTAYVMEAQRWLTSDQADRELAEQSESQLNGDLLSELPSGRLLVVDDNADMREYLRRLLTLYWKVDTAIDGLSALNAVEQRLPDLIITDVMMPTIDGFELLKRLRQEPSTAHIPVIMLSARAGEEASLEGLTAGANDYLIKPFASRELFARVKTQLLAARHGTQQREHYEISRRIALATRAEEILLALVSSSYFKDSLSAGLFWFDQPWIDTEPEYGDVLANWSAHGSQNDLTGLRFDFKGYGLSRLSALDRPMLIRDSFDPTLLPESKEVFATLGSRSFITIPLIAQGLCRGYMFAHWDYVQQCTDADIRVMQQLVDLGAAALHNILLIESEGRARKAAEQAGELKMRFMAMISHELRTPLASIKGFATTLLAPDMHFDLNEQKEFVGIINDESDKLMNLIEQLLDLTRMQAGTFGVKPEHVSIQEILDSSMAQLRALSLNHHLTIDLPRRLPRVNADKLRIGQVVTNLVNNASKYAPARSAITIKAIRENGFVRVDVSDQGPGIPEEKRESIFQPFLQIEGTFNPAASGVGLGLTIARGIVEAHGGSIWVQPQQDAGATISFTLPIAPDDWKERLKDGE